MKKPKNWDSDDEFGSDILGTGQYQFNGTGDYTSELKHKIGFVRPKESLIVKCEPQIGRKRLSMILGRPKK